MKNKTSQYAKQTSSSVGKVFTAASESRESQPSNEKTPLNVNHDAIFETTTINQVIAPSSKDAGGQNSANEQAKSYRTETNHNSYFEETLNTRFHHSQNQNMEEYGKHLQNSDETNSSTDLLLSLLARMEKMDETLQLLRRQVARMEAKSMIHHSSGGPPAHASSMKTGDENIFLDYQSTLQTEGLPIRDTEGVDVLENKLKDPSYRQRLVSFFCNEDHGPCKVPNLYTGTILY